jgi:hypothetical protein
MKEILFGIQILLTTIRTELSSYFSTTVEAVGFCSVLFMTHEWVSVSAVKVEIKVRKTEVRSR